MSFQSWLQNLRFALAPPRDRGRHRRMDSPRVTTHRPKLEVLEDRLTPSLSWVDQYPSEAMTWSHLPADFTSDGILDQIYTVGGQVAVRPGLADGTFADPIYTFMPYADLLAAADFNGDGRMDLVTTTPGSPAGDYGDYAFGSLLLGRGDGTFYGLETFQHFPMIPQGIGTGDIDGDGRPDVAIHGINPYDPDNYFATIVGLNDGDWSPYLSVSSASVTEGNTGASTATFWVTLSFASSVDVMVHYETEDRDAVAGSDYVAASGDVIIPAGETGAAFAVAVTGDRLAEPDEIFIVHLTGAVNARITAGVGVGTIVDDEPRISINNVAKKEGNRSTTVFTFTVTLSVAYDQPVTVDYATRDGSATVGGNDYVATSGTLTFAPGQTSKTITVVIKGDRGKEANETFFIDLFGASSNAFISDALAMGTIFNDDR